VNHQHHWEQQQQQAKGPTSVSFDVTSGKINGKATSGPRDFITFNKRREMKVVSLELLRNVHLHLPLYGVQQAKVGSNALDATAWQVMQATSLQSAVEMACVEHSQPVIALNQDMGSEVHVLCIAFISQCR
jgi:hypothetical protein